MDIRQMQYFLCLAETGHVTRAAHQLNIVQPALSMQIAKLEAEFGQKLFDRGAHGVTLTQPGEALVRLVTPIVRDVEHATQEMARLKGRVAGRVSAGLVTSAAQSTLASSSAIIAARYPDVELSACEGYTQTLADWVASGQLDFAIVNAPRRGSGLSAQPIIGEDMVFACRADDMPLPRPPVFAELAAFDLVLPSKRHGLRLILEEQAAEAGVELRPRLEIDTLSAIAEIVSTTGMATVLPTIALHDVLARGRARAFHFAGPPIRRHIACVHHPRRVMSPAAEAVLAVLREDLVRAAASAHAYVRPAPEATIRPKRRSRKEGAV
ncbi:transcriptional regulator [Azorhizobium oxalatiphilum]|uniref:Transcriptional regulator n=1 Tax=Azorhizobium oxalatiphilum TaxID=980631 RepID=A0A917C3K0_9HYPH|nr:LysR family transcriptional regulator [Azorhizobium oxalatiphilum]GGF70068.1 transcriptional regulator [Azorhizobium oxalatiphilum]